MSHSLPTRYLCFVALSLAVSWVPAIANTCLVTNTAGGGDGSSWATPAALQTALGNVSCTEIWVAKGVYKPALPGNQTVSFSIRSGVAVYGGFAGNEIQRSQRSPEANLTVLSGDIDNNDSVDADGIDVDATHIAGSNSYHVVSMDASSVAITGSTSLDGFTVTGGSAVPSNQGGGLYCLATMGHACSPTLAHLRFIGNEATFGGALYANGFAGNTSSPVLSLVSFVGNMAVADGGAMYNSGTNTGASSPTLDDVSFSDNLAAGNGGAMYNNASLGTAKPQLNGVTFVGNSAASGGAMASVSSEPGGPSPAGDASPALNNVTFYMNSATDNGGAMYNRSNGDIADHTAKSNPTLTNVTFTGNSATYGGAIYNYGNAITHPTLSNVILWGDQASGGGPEIYNLASGGTAIADIDYSIAEGGCPTDGGGLGGNNCTNDIYTDPQLGALADNGGPTQTILPGQAGSAFDAGTCGLPSDQRGARRPQGDSCDIGAVELVTTRVYANNFDGTMTP
jgi:predicted outer membrane repeat protein